MTEFNPFPPPMQPPSLGVLDYSPQADAAWVALVRLLAVVILLAAVGRVASAAGQLAFNASYRGVSFWSSLGTSLLYLIPTVIVYLLWGVGAVGCLSRSRWGRTMVVIMGWVVAGVTAAMSVVSLATMMINRGFSPPSFASRPLYFGGQMLSALGGIAVIAALPALGSLILSRPAAKAVFGAR